MLNRDMVSNTDENYILQHITDCIPVSKNKLKADFSD